MATIMFITAALSADPFPPLNRLSHTVMIRGPKDRVLTESADTDLILIDARTDPFTAKKLCQMFATAGISVPRVVLLADDGLAAYSRSWECDDFLADYAGPAEVEARLRVLTSPHEGTTTRLSAGGVVIDEAAYSVWVDDEPLDLTYTEFELLKFLAAHPLRVFSREQLLDEVWGYDYYGGTRTVDVHVRRLRAKLGTEHKALIGTVRNVGYRFTTKDA